MIFDTFALTTTVITEETRQLRKYLQQHTLPPVSVNTTTENAAYSEAAFFCTFKPHSSYMPFQNLYFIAIIPPKSIGEEVTAFKNDFAENYNSSKALRVLPHITLKAPFKLDATKHNEILKWFESLSVFTAPFDIQLKDFGTFDNKNNPVIFVNPVINKELEDLQKEIIQGFEKQYPGIPVSYIEKKFHPHMTVAYRDLEREEYEKAWQVYKEKQYSTIFAANSFFLLQHDTRQWNTIAEFKLK